MQGPSVFKQTLEPGVVPTTMMKSSKCSASGSGKEGILLTTKQFNFNLKVDDFEDMCCGFVLKNTVAGTEKCVQLFQSWGQARNLRFPSNEVPANILLTDDHTLLAKWHCGFSMEAHKIDGEPYPPQTLQH